MIGIFLMLVTVTAVCGLAAVQFASAMSRRVRVPVRDVRDLQHSDPIERAE
jgi:hypothetical protein